MKAQCATTNQVEVEVWAEKVNGRLQFKHRLRNENGGWGGWGDEDIVLPRDSGEHDIVFTVAADSPKQVRFFREKAKAIWVRPSRCPDAPGCDPQIADISVSDDRDRLTIHNRNFGDPVDLHYMLRFRGGFLGLGADEYDPVIRNGGGTNSA